MGKEKNISEFDSLFKQSFEGASNAVPPGVWEGVSAATTGAAGAASTSLLSKLLGIKGAAIIGSVAVVLTTAIVLSQSNDATNEVTLNESQPTEKVVDDVINENSENKPEVVEQNAPENIKKLADKTATGEIASVENPTNDNTSHTSITNPTNSQEEITNPSDRKNDNIVAEKGAGQEPNYSINMISSAEEVCRGQKVDVSVMMPKALQELTWVVDGKKLSVNRAYTSFLFNEVGIHTVQVTAKSPTGELVQSNKKIEVIEANASFKVSQDKGIISVSSLAPIKSNQWYVNQVLVKENLNATSFPLEAESNTIVHIATSLNGCKDTARQVVQKQPECVDDLKVPNVFTPYYKDRINDEFVIDMPEVEDYRLTVYNLKDGKVVFDTERQGENWNGKYNNVGAMVPVGFYLYRLVYTCNGKTTTKQDRVMVSDAKN